MEDEETDDEEEEHEATHGEHEVTPSLVLGAWAGGGGCSDAREVGNERPSDLFAIRMRDSGVCTKATVPNYQRADQLPTRQTGRSADIGVKPE